MNPNRRTFIQRALAAMVAFFGIKTAASESAGIKEITTREEFESEAKLFYALSLKFIESHKESWIGGFHKRSAVYCGLEQESDHGRDVWMSIDCKEENNNEKHGPRDFTEWQRGPDGKWFRLLPPVS